MNASEMGSKDWWAVVLSMPIVETLEHLHSFRASILEQHKDKPSYQAVCPHITRVNTEIKRLNARVDAATWQRAARNVLDEETFSKVLLEKRRLEDSDVACQMVRTMQKEQHEQH